MRIDCRKVTEFHSKDGGYIKRNPDSWEIDQYREKTEYVEKEFLEIFSIWELEHTDDFSTYETHVLVRREIEMGNPNVSHYIHFMHVTYVYIRSIGDIFCTKTEINI